MSRKDELRKKLKETFEAMERARKDMHERRDQYDKDVADGKTPSVDKWNDQDEARWAELNNTFNETKQELDRESRFDDIDRFMDEERERLSQSTRTSGHPGREDRSGQFPSGDGGNDRRHEGQGSESEQRDLAMQAWVGRRHEACRSERHLSAAQRFGIDVNSDELRINLYDTSELLQYRSLYDHHHRSQIQRRALSGHQGSSGAFTIGSTLVNAIERNMLAFGGIEQVADIIVTNTGEEMSWPTADDTSNEGEMLGENTATGDDEEPDFGNVRWNAYEFSSKALKVPVRLLEDAPANFANDLGAMLGERIGRAKNRKFTNGTGSGQPKGVVTAASLGITAASATAIDPDEIIKLEHSIDPAYRDDPSCGYMSHDQTTLAIRLLKDNEGRYLWRPGLQEGKPDTLNGRRHTTNQHMDSAVAANNKTLLFGQFSKVKVRRVRQLVLLRLRERGAEQRQEWFIAFERADCNTLDAGTAPIKYLQQAAS